VVVPDMVDTNNLLCLLMSTLILSRSRNIYTR
jgi:hypothetical protein